MTKQTFLEYQDLINFLITRNIGHIIIYYVKYKQVSIKISYKDYKQHEYFLKILDWQETKTNKELNAIIDLS